MPKDFQISYFGSVHMLKFILVKLYFHLLPRENLKGLLKNLEIEKELLENDIFHNNSRGLFGFFLHKFGK